MRSQLQFVSCCCSLGSVIISLMFNLFLPWEPYCSWSLKSWMKTEREYSWPGIKQMEDRWPEPYWHLLCPSMAPMTSPGILEAGFPLSFSECNLRSPAKIYRMKWGLRLPSAPLSSGVSTTLFGMLFHVVLSWSPSLQYGCWEHPRPSHWGSDEGFVALLVAYAEVLIEISYCNLFFLLLPTRQASSPAVHGDHNNSARAPAHRCTY